MRNPTPSIAAAVTLLVGPMSAMAQDPPPVRPIGPITHVSAEPMMSVTTAIPLADGGVYVNDLIGRRLLLFDSTLALTKVVLDSAPGVPNAYDTRAATLLSYRADSVLLITPSSASMVIIGPDGTIARVIAMPPSTTGLVGAVAGRAGIDPEGRILYVVQARADNAAADKDGSRVFQSPDSAFLVRFDLVQRAMDTVAVLRTPKAKVTMARDGQGRVTSVTQVVYPIPIVDDWAVMRDGTIAVVRGLDYHVDWRAPDGHWTPTPRMPFAWQRLTDDQKLALTDSLTNAAQINYDSVRADRARRAGTPTGGRGATTAPRIVFQNADQHDVPDYRPPIRQGSTRADVEDNLWIRTTLLIGGRPTYDVVNRQGKVVDRVQLPPFRLIAGFAPGSVFMSVLDSNKVAHLERAQVR